MRNKTNHCQAQSWMISAGKNHHWELCFGFVRDINMQDKDNELTSKAYAFLTCHTRAHTHTHTHTHTHSHTRTSSQPSPPVHPVSCQSFPAAVTPVRPVSLFGRRGYHAIHTRSRFHLFIYLLLSLPSLVSAFILSVFHSTPLARPCGHSRMSCLFTCHLRLLCSEVSMNTQVLDFTCLQKYSPWVSRNFVETFLNWLSWMHLFLCNQNILHSKPWTKTGGLLSSKSWEAVPQCHFRAA